MIAASTTALTYAMMMPEAYQDLMHAAQQFGLSRNIIAVHYPTDIIGGRIVAYYAMAQVLANNPLFVTGDYQALLQSTATTLRGAIAGGVPRPMPAAPTTWRAASPAESFRRRPGSPPPTGTTRSSPPTNCSRSARPIRAGRPGQCRAADRLAFPLSHGEPAERRAGEHRAASGGPLDDGPDGRGSICSRPRAAMALSPPTSP